MNIDTTRPTLGPYKFGPIYIPKIDLVRTAIYLLAFTALLPFVTKAKEQYNIPTPVVTIIYILYALTLFYLFGVVTIGYILVQNVTNIGETAIRTTTNINI